MCCACSWGKENCTCNVFHFDEEVLEIFEWPLRKVLGARRQPAHHLEH